VDRPDSGGASATAEAYSYPIDEWLLAALAEGPAAVGGIALGVGEPRAQ
jgi:elongation factor P--beta-lysine ligase